MGYVGDPSPRYTSHRKIKTDQIAASATAEPSTRTLDVTLGSSVSTSDAPHIIVASTPTSQTYTRLSRRSLTPASASSLRSVNKLRPSTPMAHRTAKRNASVTAMGSALSATQVDNHMTSFSSTNPASGSTAAIVNSSHRRPSPDSPRLQRPPSAHVTWAAPV